MLIITGPAPENSKQVFLPSPNQANVEAQKSSVTVVRMMDGSPRSFIKRRKGRKSFRWEFLIGKAKTDELEEYVTTTSGQKSMVSYKSEVYFGWLTLNPFEASGETGEFFRVTLEFEESK